MVANAETFVCELNHTAARPAPAGGKGRPGALSQISVSANSRPRAPMGPIGLTDTQMHELMQAAQSVPPHLRHIFLQRVADELHGKALDDGLVHRVAVAVAKTLAWDADRASS
jgi:hypothetical protein